MADSPERRTKIHGDTASCLTASDGRIYGSSESSTVAAHGCNITRAKKRSNNSNAAHFPAHNLLTIKHQAIIHVPVLNRHDCPGFDAGGFGPAELQCSQSRFT